MDSQSKTVFSYACFVSQSIACYKRHYNKPTINQQQQSFHKNALYSHHHIKLNLTLFKNMSLTL